MSLMYLQTFLLILLMGDTFAQEWTPSHTNAQSRPPPHYPSFVGHNSAESSHQSPQSISHSAPSSQQIEHSPPPINPQQIEHSPPPINPQSIEHSPPPFNPDSGHPGAQSSPPYYSEPGHTAHQLTQGHQGSLGQSGSSGYPSSSGHSGSSGYPEVHQGSSGYPGSPEHSGSSGYPGSTGHPGSSGYPGSTGYPGLSEHPGSIDYHEPPPPAQTNCNIIKRGLTLEQIDGLTRKHNELRTIVAKGEQDRLPPASNMKEMIWDEALAAKAQNWADQCKFQHAPDDGEDIGENLAWIGGGEMDVVDQISNFYHNEVPLFNPGEIMALHSTEEVGHFTQMIWAETDKVGCGLTSYDNGNGLEGILVCNYAPGGNHLGQPIYEPGKACSSCEHGCKRYEELCSPEELDSQYPNSNVADYEDHLEESSNGRGQSSLDYDHRGQSSGLEGHLSGPDRHSSSLGQSAGMSGHPSGLGQSSEMGGHQYDYGQSSGTSGHPSGSGQSSGMGGHPSGSGQSYGIGGHSSGSGQSSESYGNPSNWPHSPAMAGAVGRAEAFRGQYDPREDLDGSGGQSPSLGEHSSESGGQSYGSGGHSSGSDGHSSGYGQSSGSGGHSSASDGHSSGYGQSHGLGGHSSGSDGHSSGSGQSSGLGGHSSGSDGHSSGYGGHEGGHRGFGKNGEPNRFGQSAGFDGQY